MKETVFKVLKSFGLERDVERYMKLFSRIPAHRFAVIKISGKTLETNLQVVADDLAFLSKLGLTPIIVHGGGSQIDEAVKKGGLEIKKVDGLRATDATTMRIAKNVLNHISNKLVNAINKKGGRAISVNSLGLVKAKKTLSPSGLDIGFVGNVDRIKAREIKELCKNGHIPVFASLGYTGDTAYNINADTLAREMVKALHTKKLVLLTETGGVLNKDGEILSTIDVHSDLPTMVADGSLSGGMLLKMQEVKKLLEQEPLAIVEICSAQDLLKELFTVKGSGTFIRYGGNFTIKRSYSSISKKKLEKLLTESFGKTLVKDYFNEKIDRLIMENDYQGVAIVKKICGLSYLDKFAVAPVAKGNGLGNTLWQMIRNEYPSLIWRSSIHNPINSWYFKNADGIEKRGEWIVFWYNVKREKIGDAIDNIAKLPKTLVKV